MSESIRIRQNVRPEDLLQQLDRLLQKPGRDVVDLQFSTSLMWSRRLMLKAVRQGSQNVTRTHRNLQTLVDRLTVDAETKKSLRDRIDRHADPVLTVGQLRDMLTGALNERKSQTLSDLDNGLRVDDSARDAFAGHGIVFDALDYSFKGMLQRLQDKPQSLAQIVKHLTVWHSNAPDTFYGPSRQLQKVVAAALAPSNAALFQTDDHFLRVVTSCCVDDPDLAFAFATAFVSAEHPLSVVDAAAILDAKAYVLWPDPNTADRLEEADPFIGKKPDPEQRETYMTGVLMMVGKVGDDAPQRLGAYIDKKLFLNPTPLLVVDPKNGLDAEQVRQNRINHVSQALTKPATHGLEAQPAGFDFEAAKDALDDVMFSPGMFFWDKQENYKAPSYALAGHMHRTLTHFKEKPNVLDPVKHISAPTNPAARELVAKSVSCPAEKVTDAETQRAVINAMLYNIRQGVVGTCSTTAALIQLRAENPVRMLQMYTELATEGRFIDADGIEIPAVTNVTQDGDPLLRSLEATVMTAAIRKEASGIARFEKQAASAAARKLCEPEPQKAFWNRFRRQAARNERIVANVLRDTFERVYIPTEYTPVASDGESDRGVYALMRKGAKPAVRIETLDDWVNAIADALTAAGTKESLSSNLQDKENLKKALGDPSFVGLFSFQGLDPWQVRSGQRFGAVFAALYGKDISEKIVESASPTAQETPQWRAERAMDIVASLMASRPRPNSVIGAPEHGVTFLVGHRSHAGIDGKDRAGFKASIQKAVLGGLSHRLSSQEGANLVDDLQRQLKESSLMTQLSEDDRNFCTSGVTLQAALDYIESRFRSVYAESEAREAGREDFDVWTPKLRERKINDHFRFLKHVLGYVASEQIEFLSSPREIVFADTNWGDDAQEFQWALRLNPDTRQVDMYKIKSVSGEGMPVEASFLEGEWSLVDMKIEAKEVL